MVDRGYHPALKVTFRALEYLKGTNGSTLEALIYKFNNPLYLNMSESQARDAATVLLGARDQRWDDREAVVFLRLDEPTRRLWLGRLDEAYGIDVTVESIQYKAWLPAVETASGGALGATSTQLFYLDDPKLYEASATSTAATISLTNLRAEVADIQRWIRESGGSQEAQECVRQALAHARALGQEYVMDYRLERHTVASGQPAGSNAFSYLPEEFRSVDVTTGRVWYEGSDADLFGYRDLHATFARPLPEGEYRFFQNEQSPTWVLCDFYPEDVRNKIEHAVTVVAPEGTLAESFFDPYVDVAAVTGTTTTGTISWQAGRITADLTVDATGHALDFIGLDGTTTLSLIVADAAETDGTLTWTVTTQPWSAADKFMLRIRGITP